MTPMQIDHVAYAKKVRGMTMEQLLFVIKDCKAAIECNPTGYKAGYYADEINYCASEIHRRRGENV